MTNSISSIQSENSSVLITIITVVYNNVSHIKETIQSVLLQKYTNIEYIVIDGESDDGTLEILDEFSSDISILLIEPDKGIYDALNKGISLSNGEIVGFLHSGDFYANNNVILDIANLFTNKGSEVVYGDLDYVNSNNTQSIVRSWKAGNFYKKKLKYGWMPPHPAFYAKRDLYINSGGFNLAFKIAADYDCMIRFLQQDILISYIPKVLVKMRIGGVSNKSLKNIIQKSLEDYRIMKKNKIGGVASLIWKNLSKLKQFYKK